MSRTSKEIAAKKKPRYKRFKSIRRDPLDDLFSEFIRRRAMARVGGCEKCKTPKFDTTREDGSTRPAYMQLVAAHFHGRRPHATRWDEDNSGGLCTGCHSYLDANPIEKTAWFKEYLGEEKFELLELRRYTLDTDKQATRLYLKQKIEELKSEISRR